MKHPLLRNHGWTPSDKLSVYYLPSSLVLLSPQNKHMSFIHSASLPGEFPIHCPQDRRSIWANMAPFAMKHCAWAASHQVSSSLNVLVVSFCYDEDQRTSLLWSREQGRQQQAGRIELPIETLKTQSSGGCKMSGHTRFREPAGIRSFKNKLERGWGY